MPLTTDAIADLICQAVREQMDMHGGADRDMIDACPEISDIADLIGDPENESDILIEDKSGALFRVSVIRIG